MRHYITDDGSTESISIDLGHMFGTVNIVRILAEISESLTPQFFGIKKGGSISSDLIIKGERVFFSCCDGNFYCIDAKTGNEVWRFSASDVMSSFEMDEDMIFASCFDKNLYALSLEGKLFWKFPTKGKLGNNPIIWEDKIYFGCEDGNMYCVDRNGGLVWKYGTNAPISAIPKIYNGTLYFGNFDGSFFALDADTGEPNWKFRCNSPTGGCEIYNDTILIPATNKILYALDLDGKIKWTYKSSVLLAPNIRSGLYKGKIFMGNRGKTMTAINIKDGTVAWEFPTMEMTFSYSKLKDGILYFGSCDTNFYAVDASTGKKLWHFAATGPNVGSVEVTEDKVYFGSWDCHVYCLDRNNGRLVWKFQTSMSNMSDYEVDTRADKEELTVIIPATENDADEERPKDEVTIADYGEFSGAYIDTTKTDYLGLKKKGYVK